MAQISTANLQVVLDNLAFDVALRNGDPITLTIATGATYTYTSPNAGNAVANGASGVFSKLSTDILTTIADPIFTQLVYPAFEGMNLQNPSAIALWAAMWNAAPFAGAKGFLDALDAYGLLFNSPLPTDRGGLDAMLRVLNAGAPTLRVHGIFGRYLRNLSANNTFVELPYILGTIAVTGAGAGTYAPAGYGGARSVASGLINGGGSGGMLDTTIYGPGKIAMLNSKGSAESTLDAVTVNAYKNGVLTPVTFTAGATTDKYLTQATGDVSLTFTGVPAQVPNISSGTNADGFTLVILPDRNISAT